MTTVGYNQCNNVAITNYQQTYSNVDLNLVKNEPVDSIDYQQHSTQIYQYVQHHQQISPQLPPTPPSPTGSLNDTTINLEHTQQIINQNNQINSQMFNHQLINQQTATNQISNEMTNQINSSNHHLNNQLKQQVYVPSQNQQVVVTNKYKSKNKTNLPNIKRYNLPTSSSDQTIGRIKSNSISRRNERERKRVKNVNEGFKRLRDRIPNNEKKMSKVETLRSAVKYIRALKEMLNDPIDSTNTDILFNIIQQNAFSSLQQSIKVESELSNKSTIVNSNHLEQDQTSSSLDDYFDLAELLSQ